MPFGCGKCQKTVPKALKNEVWRQVQISLSLPSHLTMQVCEKILSPFKIGDVTLCNRLLMAPMAEITNAVTRKQMRDFGAAGCVSEMINVTGLKHNIKKNKRYLAIDPQEHPVGIQLYGKQLEDFKPAAEYICKHTTADWIDLNFGCPAPKVTRNGGGSAMMKDPELVKDVIERTIEGVAGTEVPVTVKFRLGWDQSSVTIMKAGEYAAKLGVAAIALHPRTRAERFEGHSHWEYISELKNAFPEMMIIGSGDLWTPEDIYRMFEQTNCDAVMPARGAFGNPWIFKQTLELCKFNSYQEPDKNERISTYLEHLSKYVPFKESGEKSAVCEMRKFAAKYLRGFEGAAELRRELNSIDDVESIKKLLSK